MSKSKSKWITSIIIIVVVIIVTIIYSLQLFAIEKPKQIQRAAFKDNFIGNIDTHWRYWTFSPSPSNTAISPVFDADAEDKNILQLKFSAGGNATPVQGPNLESIKYTHFGRYTARIKTPTVQKGEGLVTGFFTYFNDVWVYPNNPTDENNNSIADNSEIDIELLAAEPHVIYMSIWTDSSYCANYFRKVSRKINLRTGKIYQTPEDKRHTYDLVEIEKLFSPTIPDFDHTAKYYEYGFYWSPNSVKFWIVIDGEKVELWNYMNSENIPTHKTKLMTNLWHNSIHWHNGETALSPSQDKFLNIDWVQFQPSPKNQIEWTKFYSKDIEITTNNKLTLAPITTSITHTTDADFNTGNFFQTEILDTGNAARVRLNLNEPERWLAGYSTRRKLIIDHTKIDADLTNFPILVKLDPANFDFTKTTATGNDIKFTSSNGITLLNFERERHNKTEERAEYWVKIPFISETVNTEFYIYYSTDAEITDKSNPSAVWDINTMARWSLKEISTGTINEYRDSTINANHGQGGGGAINSTPTQIEGKISHSQRFDGINDYILIGDTFNFSNRASFTLESWFNSSQPSNYWPRIIERARYLPTRDGYNLYIDKEYGIVGIERWVAGLAKRITTTVTYDTWNHLVATYDGDQLVLYLNGISFPPLNDTRLMEIFPANLVIGTNSLTNYGWMKGIIDEVRIYNRALTPAQVKASFHSGNNALLIFGIEERYLFSNNGTFYSSNIDIGQNSNFTTLDFTITKPVGTDLRFQLRTAATAADLATAIWHGPTGTADFYTTTGTAINLVHDGHRWIQYRAFFSTTDTTRTPILSDITINYRFFPSSASLTSSPYNTGSIFNVLDGIRWSQRLPIGTNIRFQVRTSPDNNTWNTWMGPDGTSGTFFTDPFGGESIPAILRDGINDQWIQYKVWLKSDGLFTPVLFDVNLIYTVKIKIIRRPVPIPIINDIKIIDITSNQAVIIWRTNIPATSRVEYGTNPAYKWWIEENRELTSEHRITLSNLIPDTLYHLQVISDGAHRGRAFSPDLTFRTLSIEEVIEVPKIRLPEIKEVRFITVRDNEITIKWFTTLPTKTKIKIVDVKTGEKIIQKDPSYLKEHQLTIKGLKMATDYTLQIIAENEAGHTSYSPILPFTTSVLLEPLVISQVRVSTKIDIALILDRIGMIKAIFTWQTNKPATSRVFYEKFEEFKEGDGIGKELSFSTPLNPDLVLEHTVIITAFEPNSDYRFRVESIDAFGNKSYSLDFTVSTPGLRVIDLIIKTFKFLRGGIIIRSII